VHQLCRHGAHCVLLASLGIRLAVLGSELVRHDLQLMQLLEELDQVQLSDQERELRAKRKMAATRLNNALDRIDSLKERLCGAIRRCS